MLAACLSSQGESSFTTKTNVISSQYGLFSLSTSSFTDNIFLKHKQSDKHEIKVTGDNDNSILSNNTKPQPLNKTLKGNSSIVFKDYDKKSLPFDLLSTPNEKELNSSSCNVTPSEISFFKKLSNTEHSLDAEEERKLVLACVKHVDCRDFPFDEVLSLEEAAQEKLSSSGKSKMRHCTSKRIRHGSPQPTISIVHQDLFYEDENISDRTETHLHVQESKKKNRPPLLKCPTWPENVIHQDGDQATKNYSSSGTKVESNTKLDSPSFYSPLAIDFSAISHLSEEHDRLMAQEKAEKGCNKHTSASSKTKERHYGKTTQRNASANRKMHQDSNNNESTYTISSTALDGPVISASNIPSTVRQPAMGGEVNSNVTVSRKSISEILPKKSSKSKIPSVEKAFRKRYPSSCGITVSSTPYTTLQNDDNHLSSVTIDSQPLIISDSATTEETQDELKESLHITVEKQPLPPEGFKISRYPLKQPSRQSSPTDNYDQNSPGDGDLHRTISDLQRQLDRAQDRISELERQARGWKETAQQTLRAAQVIKAQLASERTNRLNSSTTIEESRMKHVVSRRWNKKKHMTDKLASEQVRPRFVAADAVISNLSNAGPAAERTNERGTKRKLPGDHPRTNDKMTDHSASMRATKNVNWENGRSNSLLKWLTDTGSDNEEIDYLSLLESDVPVACSNNQRNKDNIAQSGDSAVHGSVDQLNLQHSVIQRQTSRDQIRLAAATRLNESQSDVNMNETTKMSSDHPEKFPSRMQNSLDPFAEDFISSDSETNATEQGQESLLHTPSLTLSPQTLHAGPEMDLNEATKQANAEIKIYLTQRQNNDDGYITKTGLAEMSSQETDFLNQLDYIMELQL